MTPAQHAVIAAATAFVYGGPEDVPRLAKAVEALGAEQDAPATAERARPWSEVVTEDEIYSTRTKKWYRVLSTVTGGQTGLDGQVKVQCEGMAKPFTVPAAAEVLVRRSEMGQAVDVWIDVMRSS